MTKSSSGVLSGSSIALRAIFLGTSRVLSGMGALLIFAMLSRSLTYAEYGQYRLIWLVYTASAPILLFGLSDGVLFLSPRLKDEQIRVLWATALCMGIGYGFIFFGFIHLGGARLFMSLDSYGETISYFNKIAWIGAFNLPIAYLPSFFVSNRRAGAATTFTLVDAGSQLLAVSIPLLLLKPDISVILMCFVVLAVLRLTGWIFYCSHMFMPRITDFDWLIPKRLLGYSLPLSMANIGQNLTRQSQGIVVSHLFSVTDFAIFSNAAFRLPFVSEITGSVMSVTLPEMIRLCEQGKRNEAAALWGNVVSRIALIMFPLSVALFVFSGPLTVALFSTKYTDSILLFRLWVLELPLRISFYGNLVVALGHRRLNLIGSAFQMVLFFIVTYVFGKLYGLVGVVLGGSLAAYVMPAVYYIVSCRSLNVSPCHVFHWKSLAKTMTASLMAGGIASLVLMTTWSPLLILMVGSILFGVCYLALAIFLGVLQPSEPLAVMNHFLKRMKQTLAKSKD